jgi:prokaryotic ubiquitin-like protein Pup
MRSTSVSEGGQVRKGGADREQVDDHVEEQVDETAGASAKDLLDDVDELLDEIDDVLEENAEEFVRGYVQKGGQ